MQIFLNSIRNCKNLSQQEEKELLKLLKSNDKNISRKAEHLLVLNNIKFVIKIAKEYIGFGLPFADLVSEGCIGLFISLHKFDIERDTKLITYSVWWIRQSITRAVINKAPTIRIPYEQKRLLINIVRKLKKYTAQYGTNTELIYEELSQEINLSINKIKDSFKLCDIEMISLDKAVKSDKQSNYLIDYKTEQIEDEAIKKEMIKKLYEEINHLPPRQKNILIKKFGMFGSDQISLTDISKLFSLSKQRVKQIELSAIKLLRMRMKKYE